MYCSVHRFRPLDGESFSKRLILKILVIWITKIACFRPLDGESFSKQKKGGEKKESHCFRPLDGESFSKR